MAFLAAFAFLLLPPLLTANNSLYILHTDLVSTMQTRILLQTTVNFFLTTVTYNISMDNGLTTIYLDYQRCYPNKDNYCTFTRNVGYPVDLIIDSNYIMELLQRTSTELDVFAEGCEQDFSSCRNATADLASVCICTTNFCKGPVLPMRTPPQCEKETTSPTVSPTDLPPLPPFEFTIFYGTSHDLGDAAVIFTRSRNNAGVGYKFHRISTVYSLKIDGQECAVTDCVYIIGVGDTLVIEVGQFTFLLYQKTAETTEISYDGCNVNDLSECRDTGTFPDYYGCICPGEQTVCSQPKAMDETCPTETITTALATTTTVTTTTVTTTTVTTTEAPMYRLSVYYNSDPYAISAVNLACVVDRLATTTNGALFRILNNGYTVVVNDYSCVSDCNVTVPIGGRFTIVLSTEFKFFIEVVDDSNTLVYVDNNNCNQDLSDLCKGGLSKPDAWLYGCLCKGDRECSAPMPFDSCPSPGTSNMFTVFSSSSPSSKKEKLATIVRYPVYPFGANYYFYPETAHVITLSIYGNDGPCKPTNCSEFVTNKNILDIVIDGSIQLFVQESDTSWNLGIGKGDDNCQQNIENTCKIGKTGSEDSEYTCLCEGSKSDCFAPDYFDNCGIQDGTTVSTTTENPNSFSVSAYYGVSPDTAELAVYIERTAVSPYFAFFSIYQMSTVPVQVDGTQCNKNCTHQIKTNDRLDITMNGYMHFYIYQQHNDSIVGIGDGRCDQDLSENCKAGNSLNNGPYMTCLCETANACTDPDPFDSCQANPATLSSTSTTTTTTTTTTARPTIATMSTPTSKTDSPGDTSTTDGAVELTSPLSTSFVIVTTTSPVPSLEDLNNTPITSDNVGTVLNQTLKYSEQKCQLNSTDVDLISSILYKSANVSGLDQTDSLSILVNMDFVLFAPRTSISDDAATNFTSLLPIMVQNTNSSTIDYLTGTNIGFSAKQVNCSDPSSYQGLMDEWTKFVKINGTPEDRRNAITVPLQQISSHVFFSLYRDHKFFQGPKIYRRYDNHVYNDNKNQQTTASESNSRVKRDVEVIPRELPPSPCDDQQSIAAHSPIMSATVLQNTDTSGSKRKKRSTTDQSNEPMVHMQFNVSGLLSPLHGRFVVTWFNTTTREWATTNQCSTKREGDVVVATCNHLTDFTLIVSASLYDGSVCDIGLQTTGYVVNALSIVSLTFLFIIYICAFIPTFADTKAMRYVSGCATAKRDSISLSYTTALLLFYLTFTIFSQEEISGNACTTMGAIAYALFISTIVINIFKCIRMTLRFVPSPTRDFFQFMQRTLVFDTISIIVPFVISIILLLLTDFFNRNDAFCWVRMDYVVFATVVPISILVFNAVITSSLVAYRLFSSNMRVKKRGRHIDYNLGAKLANLLVLQFTLGMPWLLQYFTLAMPTVGVWHYLFTIVLGSQGTVLVLLFFYKRQRILRSSRHAKKLASQHTQATIVSDGSNSNS